MLLINKHVHTHTFINGDIKNRISHWKSWCHFCSLTTFDKLNRMSLNLPVREGWKPGPLLFNSTRHGQIALFRYGAKEWICLDHLSVVLPENNLMEQSVSPRPHTVQAHPETPLTVTSNKNERGKKIQDRGRKQGSFGFQSPKNTVILTQRFTSHHFFISNDGKLL